MAASAAVRLFDLLIRRHAQFTAFQITGQVGVTALLFVFAWAFMHGKGWVRWVLLVPVLMAVFSPAYWHEASRFGGLHLSLQTLLQTGACVLVFLKPSRDWFYAQKHAG